MRAGRLIRALATAWLGVTIARPAGAQQLRGTVRDSVTGLPVAGVVLSLLDSSGAVLGRLLTSERGDYDVLQPDAARRLRAQRLGFRMRELRLPVPGAGPVRLDIDLASLPSLLEPVRVIGQAQCPRRKDSDAAFALLQQARAGLLNAIVAREANPGRLVRIEYARHLDRRNQTAEQSVRKDSVESTPVSFTTAHTGEEFARVGFREVQPSGGALYYGPDADVLLDDGFAAAYCFRLVTADARRMHEVGLGFSAANQRKGRVDINGVLWIDTIARSLRDIEYHYDAPREPELARSGGRTAFQEIGNGVVAVAEWSIHMPKYGPDTTFAGEVRAPSASVFRSIEAGGELA